MRNSKLLYSFIAINLIVLMLPSCKKQQDPVDPVVTFNSPFENQIFNVLDTIHVMATITSEDRLTGLQVGLVNENLVPVLPTYTISTNTNLINTWKIDQYIPIDAIQLQSGNYFLCIRATTEATSKDKYLSIKLIELKRKLKNILLLTRSNANTTSLFSLDSVFHLQHLFDFAQDLSYATVDPVNSMLYLTGRNVNTLTAFKLDSNRILWQKSGMGTLELPYYQGLRMEGTMLMVSTSDGKLTGFGPTGDVNFYNDFGSVQYPVHHCLFDNFLVTAIQQKNGPLRYINNYYYPNGSYQNGIQVPFKVSALLPLDAERILVAGSQSEIGTLRYYYPKEPGLWTPCLFPGSAIVKVIDGYSGSYFVLTAERVYWFQSASNTLTSFVSGQNLLDVDYESISDQVITATHNNLQFFSFPQAGLVNSINVPDSLKACLLWYSK